MNASLLRRLSCVFVLLCATGALVHAAAPPAAASDQSPDSAAAAADAKDDFSDDKRSDQSGRMDWRSRIERRSRRSAHDHQGNSLVSIGHDSTLPSGEKADSVVSVLGSSTSDGDAADVVSVLGNTRVTGTVSDSAVAVIGSNYIDGKVDGD